LDAYKKWTSEEQGIEASFAIGYRLLDEVQQRYWRELAVFPGDFDSAAAGSVWQMKNGADATKLLGDMYATSMVLWEEGTDRFRLHDLARDYARTRLTEEERNASGQSHSAYFAGVLRRAEELYRKGGDLVSLGLSLFDLEWNNIRTGQAWAAAHSEIDMTAAELCSDYPDASCLDLRLHPHVRMAWLESSLKAARKIGDRRAEGNHLGNLGIVHAALGQTRKSIEYHEQARAIFHEIRDRRGEGNALGNLGSAYIDLGDPVNSIKYLEQHLVISHEFGDRRGEGKDLGNMGIAYAQLGDADKSMDYLERHLAIAREIGDLRGIGNALSNKGNASKMLGDARKAIEYQEQALAIFRRIGDRRGEGSARGNLGNAYLMLGESRKAIEYYEQASGIFRRIDSRRSEGDMWTNLGTAYESLGEMNHAIECHERALVLYRDSNNRSGVGNALLKLADELVKVGRRDEAIAHAEQAVKIFEEIESPHVARARALLEQVEEGSE
jgi:tetratricopeptide (TPR) repeat protein